MSGQVVELEQLSGVHEEVFDDRAQGECREKVQRADKRMMPIERPTKERSAYGKRAQTFRPPALLSQVAGQAMTG